MEAESAVVLWSALVDYSDIHTQRLLIIPPLDLRLSYHEQKTRSSEKKSSCSRSRSEDRSRLQESRVLVKLKFMLSIHVTRQKELSRTHLVGRMWARDATFLLFRRYN